MASGCGHAAAPCAHTSVSPHLAVSERSPLQHSDEPSCSSALQGLPGGNVVRCECVAAVHETLSGVMFWGGAGKLQPYNYCQSAPECGDQSSDKPLSGAKGRLSAGYSELDLTSLTISSLLGPQHGRMLLSGGK